MGALVKPSDYVTAALSVAAILASVAAMWLARRWSSRQVDMGEQHFLNGLWNGVLDLAFNNTNYLDVNVTENYRTAMTDVERMRYDVYCHKAWGQVNEVVERGYDKQPKFQVAIQWLVTFHHAWLDDNPAFFRDERFWKAVDRGKSMPAVILRHRRLPQTADGEIDWDRAAPDYHTWLLSPLNPEMIREDAKGEIRNVLVRELRRRIDLATLGACEGSKYEIADFGCGPGNLLEAVKDRPVRVIGVDKEAGSLAYAKLRAKKLGVDFESCDFDLSDAGRRLGRTFDTIVAINSILPKNRADVAKMLLTVRNHLDPHHGRLLAIMPSFDTTQHLHRLWYEQFCTMQGSSDWHATHVVKSLQARKLVDIENLRYADDGHSLQCYHTPESMNAEFNAAGLRILKMEKVRYPWDLCRKFDYGYFPGKEEIWDWYVEAEVAWPVGQQSGDVVAMSGTGARRVKSA